MTREQIRLQIELLRDTHQHLAIACNGHTRRNLIADCILHLAHVHTTALAIFAEPLDDTVTGEEITSPPFALQLDLEAVAQTHADDISNLAERVSALEDRVDPISSAVRTIQDTIDSPVPMHRLRHGREHLGGNPFTTPAPEPEPGIDHTGWREETAPIVGEAWPIDDHFVP